MTIQANADSVVHATDAQLARAFYAKLLDEMRQIKKFLATEQLDIDEWKWEQSATTFQPIRNYDGPIVITAILAVYPVTSTSVTINLGAPGRIIPVPISPPASATTSNTGSAVTPAAGTQIAGVLVGPGTYTVNWDVGILTAAATTPNNMRVAVNNGVTTFSQSENGTAVGAYPNQLPATIVINSISTIGVYAIGAEATGTYEATITVTPVATANTSNGIFAIDDLRIQCAQDDVPRNMVISPAGPGYINFFGYADKKVVDTNR